MHPVEYIAIIVPAAILLLTSAGSGIVFLVKFTAWLTSTKEAQISTARSNQEIADKLDKFVAVTTDRFEEHNSRISVLEYAMRSRRSHDTTP